MRGLNESVKGLMPFFACIARIVGLICIAAGIILVITSMPAFSSHHDGFPASIIVGFVLFAIGGVLMVGSVFMQTYSYQRILWEVNEILDGFNATYEKYGVHFSLQYDTIAINMDEPAAAKRARMSVRRRSSTETISGDSEEHSLRRNL